MPELNDRNVRTLPCGWICLMQNSQMAYGWQKIDGQWYYFQPYDSEGHELTHSLGMYDSGDGVEIPAYYVMVSGWCKPIGEDGWFLVLWLQAGSWSMAPGTISRAQAPCSRTPGRPTATTSVRTAPGCRESSIDTIIGVI